MPNVAVDTRNAGASSSGATSISWNHTVNSGLSNSMIMVGATTGSGTSKSITSVTYNAGNLSNTVNSVAAKQDAVGPFVNANLWWLASPAAGTLQVVVTASASCELTGGSASYQNVNSGTPFNAASPHKATSSAGVNPSLTATSAAGEMVVDNIAISLLGLPTAVVGSGQTQIYNVATGSAQSLGASSDEAGAASVVMNWTGLTSEDAGAQVAVSLVASSASGQPRLTLLGVG